MPRNSVLRCQSRKMVFEVLSFMKKEAEQGLQLDLKMVQKRTAAATGVSVSTIKRILAESRDPNTSSSSKGPNFRTPGKKRRGQKRITGTDSFELGVIKRCVQSFHKTYPNQKLTIQLLLNKLRQDINFKGSHASLRTILKNLGFKRKTTQDNKRILVEHSDLRLKRIEYLKNLAKYREEGRPIIYVDELYVDHTHTKPTVGNNVSTPLVKKNLTKARLVILHAGSERGFVPNALLIIKEGIKVEQKNVIDHETYEQWVRNQLIPNLPNNSVVVFDNASYHNKLDDAAPTSDAKKAEMEAWLRERSIPYSSEMLKPELYKLIRLSQERHKKYYIDKLLREHNHTVLRLPPLHADLNPIEYAWAGIRDYVGQSNATWNVDNVIQSIEQKVHSIDMRGEWKEQCIKVRIIEEEYRENDVIIDRMTEDFNIKEDFESERSESEDDDTDEMQYSSSDDDEEMLTSDPLA